MERHRQLPELEPEAIAGFANTFISRWDCFSKQLDTGKYVRVNRPLTIQHVYDHLYGLANMSLGAYALDADSQARWVCFDADTDAQFAHLTHAVGTLAAREQTGYLERSRRGGHLWLFFTPLAGYDARRFAEQLAIELGIDAAIERYPKQDYLLEDGYGSLVRLPLGIHRKSGQRYHFINPDGSPLALTIRDQIRLLAASTLVSSEFIGAVLTRAPHREQVSPTPAFTRIEGRADIPLSEAVKGAISVFDFISGYIDLNANGIGLCPFHDDQEYSFGVDKEGNYWHCFAGCGGGSIIDFWMKWRGKIGQDPGFVPTVLEMRDMLMRPSKSQKRKRKGKKSS